MNDHYEMMEAIAERFDEVLEGSEVSICDIDLFAEETESLLWHIVEEAGLAPGEGRAPRETEEKSSREGIDPTTAVRRYIYERQLKECPAAVARANREMVARAKGRTPDGLEVDLADDLLQVEECTWDGETISFITVKADETSVPLYFFNAYCFHPGNRPSPFSGGSVQRLPHARKDRIVVIDTGECMNVPGAVAPANPDDIDVITGDLARGHGPAIVSLIDDLVRGSKLEVVLHQVRYFQGVVKDTNKQPCALVMPAPDGSDDWVRGFDEVALRATLDQATPLIRDGDIVNLSLGTVTCPERMSGDRVGEWMRTQAARGVRFVVAAGNHGTKAPSWPAAYSREWVLDQLPNISPIRGVRAVGSGTNLAPDEISAQNPKQPGAVTPNWVTDWDDGMHVPIRHPEYPLTLGATNATWSGTSFAAPRVAAELARKDPRVVVVEGHDKAMGGVVVGGPGVVKPPSSPNGGLPGVGLIVALRQSLGRFATLFKGKLRR